MPCKFGKKTQILGTFGWTNDTVCTHPEILRKMPPGRQDTCMFPIDPRRCPKYTEPEPPAPVAPPTTPPVPPM